MQDFTTIPEAPQLFETKQSPTKADPSTSVLLRAQELIHGERQDDYGDPKENLQHIADVWTAYLKGGQPLSHDHIKLTAIDVCAMMQMVKACRMYGEYQDDGVVDIAGYAGLMERVK